MKIIIYGDDTIVLATDTNDTVIDEIVSNSSKTYKRIYLIN